ncbi:macro domain-containing protein [Alicyclobacillus kakegawensis]|uniref:macro domain-containing protein n=1 Tax=Alicyclobacillus kakegawensis TaxID=392012 RepID=UPI000834E125|nr:macro domain-containing protein [Alicyclobacillus kakegawensis]
MTLHNETGDITKIRADAIVNAANAKGYMGGWLGKYIRLRGVAESIHYATSGAVEKEAKRVVRANPPGLGDVYVAGAHGLPATWVLHAVTILKPGSRSSIEVVERCVDNIRDVCHSLRIRTVAVLLLGTGTGRVQVRDVEELYEVKFGEAQDLDIVVIRCD